MGVDALRPGVKAALTRTASNMSTAAEIYTKADQSLGDSLRQAVFGVGGQGLAGVASNVQGQFSSLMGSSLDNVVPGVSSALDKVARLRMCAAVRKLGNKGLSGW